MGKRLSSWTFRSLNLPSRLILLKSILQTFPIYSFSSLEAPSFILTTIKTLQRNFLWKGAKNEWKIALISWEKICKPKLKGGLGLRDPTILNKVLSAKIWWRWLKRPKDLWARLWRKKYVPNIAEKQLIRWNENTLGSLIWNAAKQIHSLIADHTFWEVQNGRKTSFWYDSWKQWPSLAQNSIADNILSPTTQVGLITVTDYWQEDPLEQHGTIGSPPPQNSTFQHTWIFSLGTS
jgi:hypothetical protein